jgi:hypothetical protein
VICTTYEPDTVDLFFFQLIFRTGIWLSQPSNTVSIYRSDVTGGVVGVGLGVAAGAQGHSSTTIPSSTAAIVVLQKSLKSILPKISPCLGPKDLLSWLKDIVFILKFLIN